MPYIAARPRLIGGTVYERGQMVDTSAFSIAKLGSMIRAGLLIQADEAEFAGVQVIADPNVCPVCDEGPFKRLAQHITRTHKE